MNRSRIIYFGSPLVILACLALDLCAFETPITSVEPSQTASTALIPALIATPVENGCPVGSYGSSPCYGTGCFNPDDYTFVQSDWAWQVLPQGLLWRSYLAGPKEPRMGVNVFYEGHSKEWFWDATLGGRFSLLRYGTFDPIMPQGVELQVEGAAFPRLTLDSQRDLVACDYRFGIPLVFRRGPIEGKFSYYHLSAHLGDEYMLTHPHHYRRINYSRDCLVAAVAFYPIQDLRVYGEIGWAFYSDGGTDPWEFQLGADYCPIAPTGRCGAPFFAINGHFHEEHNFGGALTVQAGWAWRGRTGHLLRTGLHYFNGMSEMYEFFGEHESQIGLGIWLDY